MPQDRIEGKFYPLQHDEWLRACQELTPAQRDVLYFIRTLDPYGNGLRISAAEIARQLSTPQKTVHRQTISRALKELDVREFIDLELLEVQIEVKPKGYWCDETPSSVRQDTNGASGHQRCVRTPAVRQDTSGAMRHQRCDETPVVSQDTTLDRETPRAIATHHATSETRSGQGSDLSKIYKEYKDSLSEGEREKFSAFCFRKAGELPKPPVLVEKWIERYRSELLEAFQKENSLSAENQGSGGEEENAAAVTKLNISAVSVVKKVYTPEEIEEICQKSLEETKRRRAAKEEVLNRTFDSNRDEY